MISPSPALRGASRGLDILVNDAGLACFERVEAMPLKPFDRGIEHFLRMPFVLSRAAIPHMRARGAGWILNIGSATAQPPLRPFDEFARHGGATVYATIKAALNRFTQGLAAECTGLIAHSLHFPLAYGLPVYTLDGRSRLPPPVVPAWTHPDTDPTGK